MTDDADKTQGLLDTSVIIDYGDLMEKLPSSSAISAVTLAELSAGLYATNDPTERVQRQVRLQWLEATFSPLPFEAEAARTYGSLSGLMVAAGRRPRKRLADLQIAATAVSNGLTLYTRNPHDFKGLERFLNVAPL